MSISNSAQGAHWMSLKTVIVVVGVLRAEVVVVLGDSAEDPLDVVDAADVLRLRATATDRDRVDRAGDSDHGDAEQHAGNPGAQPATAL